MFTFVVVVAFICHHFGGNAPRDVVSALHREVVPCHQSYSFPPSSQQLSEAIQQVVKEHRMTWFQFARYLLLSKTHVHLSSRLHSILVVSCGWDLYTYQLHCCKSTVTLNLYHCSRYSVCVQAKVERQPRQ